MVLIASIGKLYNFNIIDQISLAFPYLLSIPAPDPDAVLQVITAYWGRQSAAHAL